MSLLSQVKSGKEMKPPFLLVYGVDGVGKSTLGAGAPKPIFLGPEVGSHTLDVARFPTVTHFDQAVDAVNELIKEKHNFKTLVIDSLDWLEQLLWADICGRDGSASMSVACGGFGKAYDEAAAKMEKFKNLLLKLREKMGVVIICHAEVVKFSDPAAQLEYDRYQLKLHKKVAPLFREAVDAVLFCNFEVFARKTNGDKARPQGDGARVMYTERRPSHDAKNRFNLPYQLPLSWEELMNAMSSEAGEKPEAIIASIQDLMKDISSEKVKANVAAKLAEFGKDQQKLLVLKNKVMAAAMSA